MISSDLVSAYPLRESREAVDLVDAVQQEVCSARAKLRSLYKTFHDDYASASRNGTPAAGSFSCECMDTTTCYALCAITLLACLTATSA